MRSNILGNYKKAMRVIDSCENMDHITAAKKYTNLFLEIESSYVGYNKYGMRELTSDELVSEMYRRLRRKLLIKELDLS